MEVELIPRSCYFYLILEILFSDFKKKKECSLITRFNWSVINQALLALLISLFEKSGSTGSTSFYRTIHKQKHRLKYLIQFQTVDDSLKCVSCLFHKRCIFSKDYQWASATPPHTKFDAIIHTCHWPCFFSLYRQSVLPHLLKQKCHWLAAVEEHHLNDDFIQQSERLFFSFVWHYTHGRNMKFLLYHLIFLFLKREPCLPRDAFGILSRAQLPNKLTRKRRNV